MSCRATPNVKGRCRVQRISLSSPAASNSIRSPQGRDASAGGASGGNSATRGDVFG